MFFYNDISRHPHQVFAPCLRKICSLVRAQKFPALGTSHSQRGNKSFPTWEQLISNLQNKIYKLISEVKMQVRLNICYLSLSVPILHTSIVDIRKSSDLTSSKIESVDISSAVATAFISCPRLIFLFWNRVKMPACDFV